MIVGDGVEFVKKASDSQFDMIIIDSTDPSEGDEGLFTKQFYQDCLRIMK